MFPLRLCGGKLLVAVTRERRYGPSRLRVNDDDDCINLLFGCRQEFVMGLSLLLRGTLLEKLEWTSQLSTVSRAKAAGPIDRTGVDVPAVRHQPRRHHNCRRTLPDRQLSVRYHRQLH